MRKNTLENKVDPVTYNRKRRLRGKSTDLSNGVNAVLKKIRPLIQMHGGDVQIDEMRKGILTLKVYGACVGCPLADLTYNKTVGEMIKKKVPGIEKIIII